MRELLPVPDMRGSASDENITRLTFVDAPAFELKREARISPGLLRLMVRQGTRNERKD